MTLKFIQGFETCRADSDLRIQGWSAGAAKTQAYFGPSINGQTGKSMLMQDFATSTTNVVPGASTAGAYAEAIFDPKLYVNNVYNAGGFTLGAAMQFNPNNTATSSYFPSASYINGSAIQQNLAFDGVSTYYAIDGTCVVWKSTDLNNWTKTAAQPVFDQVSAAGVKWLPLSGILVIPKLINATATRTPTLVWSRDGGATWNTTTLLTAPSTYTWKVYVEETGNSAAPFVVACHCNTANQGQLLVGDFTSATPMTSVATFTTASPIGTPLVKTKTTAGVEYISVCNANGFYSAQTQAANLNTAAAWSMATSPGGAYNLGMVNGTWCVCIGTSNVSIYVGSADGTPPSGTISWTASPIATNIWFNGLTTINNVMYATGAVTSTLTPVSYVYSSTNGITWNPVAMQMFPVSSDSIASANPTSGTAGFPFIPIYNSVTQRWYTSGGFLPYRGFFSSPDLVNDWRTESLLVAAETAGTTTNVAPFPLGLSSGTALTAGVITGAALSTYVAATVDTVSSSTRSIGIYGTSAKTAITTLSAANGYHYYELVGRPTSGTVNSFDITLYIDGAPVGTKAACSLAAATDGVGSSPTAFLYISLASHGQIVAWDDMYLTVDDGHGVVGPLGPVVAAAVRPSVSVQEQWTRVDSTISNAQNTRQGGLSSRVDRGVTSVTSGQKDIYQTQDTLPTGYKPIAVQFEGYASQVGNFPSSAVLSIQGSGAEIAAPTVTVNSTSPTYVNQVAEVDGAGSAWTAAEINALKFSVTKS